MSTPQSYDAIIIGAGQGAALARMLCEGGKRVALIEKEAVGGSCVNRGCTPTKAHIACAKRAHDARNARGMGVFAGDVEVDLKAVTARSAKIVAHFRDEIHAKLEALTTLTLIDGAAAFSGPHEVVVQKKSGVQRLSATDIIIATGTRAAIPQIEGLETVAWLDHRSLLQLETLPEKLLVLGGGYIACEFAQMFRRFGSQVTMAQSAPQLLEREDPDVSGALTAILRGENIEIHLNCEAKNFEKTARGFKCHFEDGSFSEATHLLLATGQVPNTDALKLGTSEVRLDESGHVQTDEFLSAAPGIWAMGDVKGGPAFTHIAYDDARILADTLLKNERRSTQDRPVPYSVFTDPQLGRIGLTEKEARAAGHSIRVAKLPCSETARGIESGESAGFLKAIVDSENLQILGGAFLCRDGGEIIAVLQTAMTAKMPYTALRDGVFAHPTFAESLNNLFIAMDRENEEGCLK